MESSLYIDTQTTELITNIISQMFKCRKGVNEVSDNILCEVIQCSLEYLKITDVFSQSLSCHLEQRNFTNEEINETKENLFTFNCSLCIYWNGFYPYNSKCKSNY